MSVRRSFRLMSNVTNYVEHKSAALAAQNTVTQQGYCKMRSQRSKFSDF